MPQVQATLEYLQRLSLYKREKPYWCFLPLDAGYDPNTQRADNLEFEEHNDIPIRDLREHKDPVPHINDCGFQLLSHHTRFLRFETAQDVDGYRKETEELLTNAMGAVYVNCYDSVLRKNIVFEREYLDLADPLHTEGPARGVHNGERLVQNFQGHRLISGDITYESGPVVINRYMSDTEKTNFLKAGYRIRIINTWRPLVPVLEDRPLAFCDSRSVDPSDLVATDRIIPDNVQGSDCLCRYWVEKQTPEEPLIFVMYDTKAGSHARFCPHVSFKNPNCPEGAPPRESVETRSIVITKDG
ncbi:hypothetical protein VTL71DRAFT_3739 [Oculimacula yallundae]|uniref:Methyltransferase n=1 Tax=Oculimacula yallundae TaxID=86028 RepID=A0ABR4C4H5_9HELO